MTPTRPATDAPSRRLAALVVALAVTLAGAIGGLGLTTREDRPAAAQVDGGFTTDPEQAAAGWLARQLDAGRITAPGDVTDAALALYGAGVARESADAALDRLTDTQVRAWITSGGTDFAPGAAGKALVTLAAAGRGSVWAGIDLPAELRASMRTSGPRTGEFPLIRSATVGSGFYQAWAIMGLARTGSVPTEALDWLLSRQCPGGGFPSSYGLTGSCSASPGHVDATAMAVMALLVVPNTAVVADARTRAASWLEQVQKPSGGWDDNDELPTNTNSTGLAANALRAVGRTTAVHGAVNYVVARQLGCNRAEAERGAVVWASTADSGMSDQTRRATAQALLALGAPPYGSIVAPAASVAAPTLDCPDTNPPPTDPPSTDPPSTDPPSTDPPSTDPPGRGNGHGGDGGGGTGGSGRTGGGQAGSGRGGAGASRDGDPTGVLPDILRRWPDGPATGAESPDETDPERPADRPADDDEVVARDRVAEEDAAGPLDAATRAARPDAVRATDDGSPVGPAMVAGALVLGLLLVVAARSTAKAGAPAGGPATTAGAAPARTTAAVPTSPPGDGVGTRTEDLPGYG